SWAARVTETQCLQWIRREKKHINFDIMEVVEPSVDEKISFELEAQDVMNFLETLNDRYRIAINMFIIEGYSHKEISKHLGITESSSRSLVARARKMIVAKFSEKCPLESNKNEMVTSLTTMKKIKKLA
ncbi:MAG: RNA polymerase sigma factor (sigma-70 family), partial [Saprospiraceae bacterium]